MNVYLYMFMPQSRNMPDICEVIFHVAIRVELPKHTFFQKHNQEWMCLKNVQWMLIGLNSNEIAELKPGGGIFTFCILLLWEMAIK